MTPSFNINEHLADNKDAVDKLKGLTNILSSLDKEKIKLEEKKLASEISDIKGFTKKIVDHATNLHNDYVTSVAGLAKDGKITRERINKVLHSKAGITLATLLNLSIYSQSLSPKKLQDKSVNLSDIDDQSNKFVKLMAHNIDEEEGHELWALQDVLFLGEKDSIDVMDDVLPEAKAIVWSQHDRLTRNCLPLGL